jgi:hypothetical protein
VGVGFRNAGLHRIALARATQGVGTGNHPLEPQPLEFKICFQISSLFADNGPFLRASGEPGAVGAHAASRSQSQNFLQRRKRIMLDSKDNYPEQAWAFS